VSAQVAGADQGLPGLLEPVKWGGRGGAGGGGCAQGGA
jgi:hypothetical protein